MGKKSFSLERLVKALNAATYKVKRGGLVDLDDVGGGLAFAKRKNKKRELVDTLACTDEDAVALDYRQINLQP
jgi:hypothetical protein